MQWYDVHVHIGRDEGGVSASRDEVAALFDDGWIDKAVVFCMDEVEGIEHGNRRIREIVEDDDRLAGLFRVDPAIHAPDDLETAADEGFAGFKLHPRSQDFGLQRVHDHLRVAGDRGLPVLVHTGVGDSIRRRAHPEEVLEAAELHRGTDIIMAHNTKGYYFHAPERFRNTMKTLDNVYIDSSLHCTPLSVETLVDDLGADRVLFASDYPYGHPVPMQKNVEFADIDDAAAEQVAWRNTDRLFFDDG